MSIVLCGFLLKYGFIIVQVLLIYDALCMYVNVRMSV